MMLNEVLERYGARITPKRPPDPSKDEHPCCCPCGCSNVVPGGLTCSQCPHHVCIPCAWVHGSAVHTAMLEMVNLARHGPIPEDHGFDLSPIVCPHCLNKAHEIAMRKE